MLNRGLPRDWPEYRWIEISASYPHYFVPFTSEGDFGHCKKDFFWEGRGRTSGAKGESLGERTRVLSW